MKVLVVGGGIGGLTLAHALKKVGVKNVKVFEKAKEWKFDQIGSGIGLWNNALQVMESIGLGEKIMQQGKVMKSAGYKNYKGQWLAKPSKNFGTFKTQVLCMHRHDLQKLLLESLPQEQLHTDSAVAAINADEKGVELVFENGKKESGDVVIGCDGIWSKTREQLFPEAPKPKYTGYVTFRGVLTSYTPAPGDVDAFESWGPHQRFALIPLKAPYSFWYAAMDKPESQLKSSSSFVADANLKQELLQQYAAWHEPVAELLANTLEKDILVTPIYDLRGVKQWHKGRVVLLGDAVHATQPNLAQGACLAIEDAAELANLLRDKGNASAAEITQAFQQYQQVRQKRAVVVQTISDIIAKVGQTNIKAVELLRDNVILSPLVPTFVKTFAFDTVLKYSLGWNYEPPKL